MKAILLDIEGTTTPIDFVHKTLFPFAKARILDFIRENLDVLIDERTQLANEQSVDAEYSNAFDSASPESVAAYLEYMIDKDRKSTPLKSIQGKIWREGYEKGELRSIVFEDVPRAFERWNKSGKTVAIYSSGSVLAQQLLFRYTDYGDLTPFISGYFDTHTGPKRDAKSYWDIAEELAISSADILFVSDILAELDAAKTAGCETALSVRQGNEEVIGEHSHRIIYSFEELEPQNT